MNRSNVSASFDVVHLIMDILFQLIALGLTALVWGRFVANDEWDSLLSMFVIFLIIFLVSNRASNIYNNTLFFYLDRVIKRESMAFFTGASSGVLIYFFCLGSSIEPSVLLGFLTVSYCVLLLKILLFRNIIDRIINRKHVPRVIYVGSKDSYNKFRYFLNKTPLMVNEIGYVSFDDNDESIEYIGCLSNLEQIIRKYNIDQVFILQKREMDIPYIQKYIDLCIEMGITCRVIVDIYRRRKAFSYNSSIGTYPIMTYHTVCMNTWESACKRIFDILFSIVGIILTSPIMLITAIAIKLDSPGPVIFKQVRVGKNGRHFKIWKFRSMNTDADEQKAELMKYNEVEDGRMFKIKDDPRVTKVGRFIRKTSIDELPQFFNVLFGSMSFVGTRPPTLDEVEKYTTDQWRRISIKPGITGMWQANGRSNITDFDEVVGLDVDYIDNWSLWMDIKILFKTVSGLVKHEGSY
ncbi:sugar transferase [Butyrivibrio sp. AC2005]|uniref:sugar transferase n=1 Tax=Butyrivibrio sp. AC2005 TaxID=1280672 RepID=UPI0003F6F05D|nr:sugar transferase [Butyrivibrio sp. AC2005]